MAQAGYRAVRELVSILAEPAGGVEQELLEIAHSRGVDAHAAAASVIQQNASPELLDKTGLPTYPALHVSCERVSNELREKFRSFSGTVGLAIEVRVTHDRLEGLEEQLHACVDAVTAVLDRNRGTWPQGMFFSGAYEVAFSAAKRGGRNYVQTARVRLSVDVSM
ncbi:MAG TPA: hypothetical protein VFL57_02640 [Bryobacteraceae bacterium]|nr:hypothetical protein [Bryobacteraceae bacterium]